ncbi:MAG: hypothetical protein ACRC2H_05700 [Silanimonas sp.]
MTGASSPVVRRVVALAREPLARLGAAGAAAGALAFLLIGVTPASTDRPTGADAAWSLPAPRGDLAEADAILASQPVWASQPTEAATAGPAQVPPKLVGIVSDTSGRRFALLEWPDGRRLRAGVGDEIPGEGRMRGITSTTARWRREDGTRFEARLFLNPEPREVGKDDPQSTDE